MRITSVTAHVLRLPEVSAACDGTQDTCLIRIDTDEGITGWGEVDSAPTVVKAIVEAPLSHQICNGLANVLTGQDPLAVDACMVRMWDAANYYGRAAVGTHAMAGVNLALWDIAGKAAGVPVYQLFGGPHRTRFRAYCSILFGDTPAQTYELARRYADEGFTAIKFGWGPMGQSEELDIALVREARRGAGDEVDILIDAGQVWTWKTALKRAEQFAEFRPFWLEEPLHPDNLDGYARLSEAVDVRIAAGEQESSRFSFLDLMDRGHIDIVQVDVTRCGGLTEAMRIARLAEDRHKPVVNHSFTTGINLAASLHFTAALKNAFILEYCVSPSPMRRSLTKQTFEVMDGIVKVPEEPGLGVELDEEAVAKYRIA